VRDLLDYLADLPRRAVPVGQGREPDVVAAREVVHGPVEAAVAFVRWPGDVGLQVAWVTTREAERGHGHFAAFHHEIERAVVARDWNLVYHEIVEPDLDAFLARRGYVRSASGVTGTFGDCRFRRSLEGR
jgi:hypothetical protein